MGASETYSLSIAGVRSPLHSALSQELVLEIDRGLTDGTLFGKPATLESQDKSIAVACPENIAVSYVGAAESKSCRLLLIVTKEPAEFPEAVYSAGTEAEPLSASPGSYIDVKVLETVIAIESGPTKANGSAAVVDLHLGAVPHV